MPWLSATPPPTPQHIGVAINRHATTLTWSNAGDTLCYNIYASYTYPVDTEDPTQLLKSYVADTTYREPTQSLVRPRHYAITAIDRYGNESIPLQWENKVIRPLAPRF